MVAYADVFTEVAFRIDAQHFCRRIVTSVAVTGHYVGTALGGSKGVGEWRTDAQTAGFVADGKDNLVVHLFGNIEYVGILHGQLVTFHIDYFFEQRLGVRILSESQVNFGK